MAKSHKLLHKQMIKKAVAKHHKAGEKKEAHHEKVEKVSFAKIDAAMKALHAIHPAFYPHLKKKKKK